MNNFKRARDRSRSFLPHDIILDIVLRLPARSIARFRSVSKSWHAMASDPSFVRSHAAHTAHGATIFMDDPLWMRKDFINFYILPTSSDVDRGVDTWINKPDEKMMGFDTVLSCHGMVCIGGDDYCYYICNPLTSEWIATVHFPYPQYPNKSVKGVGYMCAFYFHASTGEYRLLGVSGPYLDPGKPKFQVLTLGTNTWRTVNSSVSIFEHLVEYSCGFTLNGKVHWVSHEFDSKVRWVSQKFINFFDTVSEEFQQILPPSSPHEEWDFDNYLLEIDGRLGLCQVTSETRMDIWVLKDYTREGEWIKRHTISFKGIPAAPNMYGARLFLPLIGLNPLLPMITESSGSPGFVYDLELKQLKKIEPLIHQTGPCVPYAETLMSSNSLYLHLN